MASDSGIVGAVKVATATPLDLETSPRVTRLSRVFLVALGLGAGSLFVPESAAAHIANYNYKFPLPLWVFLTGGALAVLASAPAAAFAVGERRDWTTRSFYTWSA